MTHYMELLSLNQPYNLILYMVIPMGLAELLVAMEFFTMYHMDSGKNAGFKAVSKFVGIVLGVYFTALMIYFLAKIYPTIKWRGYADVIAIYSYLIGVIPLLGIALLELNLIYKNASQKAIVSPWQHLRKNHFKARCQQSKPNFIGKNFLQSSHTSLKTSLNLLS